MCKLESGFSIYIGFKVVAKGVNKVIAVDEVCRGFMDDLPDGFSVRMSVLSSPNVIVMEKSGNLFYSFKSSRLPGEVDVDIVFKSCKFLCNIMSGNNSISSAFNNKEIMIRGNIKHVLTVAYLLEKFAAYVTTEQTYRRVYGRAPSLELTRGKMAGYLLFARRIMK